MRASIETIRVSLSKWKVLGADAGERSAKVAIARRMPESKIAGDTLRSMQEGKGSRTADRVAERRGGASGARPAAGAR